MVIPMVDQLEMFSNYIRRLHVLVGKIQTNYIIKNSLFLVATGSDDFVDNYFSYPTRKIQYDIPSYTNFLVSEASTFVQVQFSVSRLCATIRRIKINQNLASCDQQKHKQTIAKPIGNLSVLLLGYILFDYILLISFNIYVGILPQSSGYLVHQCEVLS